METWNTPDNFQTLTDLESMGIYEKNTVLNIFLTLKSSKSTRDG